MDETGYETLRLFSEETQQMENSDYKINMATLSIVNKKGKEMKQSPHRGGYRLMFNDALHRVIWQHVNGPIPADKEVDHIDGEKSNNRIENLQLLSHSENCKKAAIDRDFSYCKDSYKNRQPVQVINLTDNKIEVTSSMYGAFQLSGVNTNLIKLQCSGQSKCKLLKGRDDKMFLFAFTSHEPTITVKKGKALKIGDELDAYKEERLKEAKEKFKVYQRERKQRISATMNVVKKQKKLVQTNIEKELAKIDEVQNSIIEAELEKEISDSTFQSALQYFKNKMDKRT